MKTLFETKNEKGERKKKKQNEKIIKDKIIRNIRILFQQKKEEDYYEPKRVNNFGIIITSNVKIVMIKLETYHYHLMNILTKLKLTSDKQKSIFISLKDTEEEYVMHLSRDNIKFTSYSKVNDVIEKLFKLLRSKYKDGLETSTKGSDFIFHSVQLVYYKYHKVNFKCAGSYIDSPYWIKKKKTKINPKIKMINVFNSQQLLH